MKIVKFLIGLILGAVILLVPISQFQASPIAPLQDLAVQLEGRKKPLDTVARETVALIHGRTSYQTADGTKLDYLNTYLSMWLNNRNWNEEPFILFSYRPLKEAVGLDPEQKYFSFSELIRSDLGDFVQQVHQKQLTDEDLERNEREALTIEDRLALTVETVGNDRLPLVPHPTDKKGAWVGLTEANQYYDSDAIIPLASTYDSLRESYKDNPQDLAALGAIADDLHTGLSALSPDVYPQEAPLAREVRFYGLHPFAKAWLLYGLGFVVMLAVLLFNWDFYDTAIAIFGSGLAIHGYGFLERMQIAGRPPVTNMYESVIWVGFGVAAIALLFEAIYKAKYYLLAAAPLAIVCLILADSLPAILDPTIKPLVPVLRDNFWLSIHVPTITLSYASFALAMGLSHIILGHYIFAPAATGRIRSLSKWNYGVVQVGVLLLATGIILGGIWAHFAWGRFWGWDTKETWALIALMCYVVPLHGRLVGWLKDFGMAVTSVVAFNAVLMAWYGVNFVLGTGLHSYGFGTGDSIVTVAAFVGADLLFVLAATAKHKSWFTTADSALEAETVITQEPELVTTDK